MEKVFFLFSFFENVIISHHCFTSEFNYNTSVLFMYSFKTRVILSCD